jgi:hypothetical protein
MLLAAALLGHSPSAAAQAEAPVGVRAAGLGGAFVGVADDASATYWNPAGLASGAFFSLVLDRSSWKPADFDAAGHPSTVLLAAGTPPVGFSYYRIASKVKDRPGFVTSSFGVTVDQSLRDGLAVGATLRAVRGTAEGVSKTVLDADFGVMASGALGRVGVAVRNAFEPEFSTSAGDVRLQRRVRGGFSLLVRQVVRVAADTDFTTADTPGGSWRDAAVGAEAHPLSRGWVRAGLHWNTAGGPLGTAPVASVGGSAAVYGSLLVDAQVSAGSKNGNRGWGVGLRYNF